MFKNGYLVSASQNPDSQIKVWNATNGNFIVRLLYPNMYWTSIAVLNNDDIACGCSDSLNSINSIIIWDWKNSKIKKEILNEHKNIISSLTALKSGFLVSTDEDGYLKIWNTNFVKTITNGLSPLISSTELPNGKIACSTYNKRVLIIDQNTGSVLKELNGHTSWVMSVVVLKNGYLATSGMDRTIKIWNSDTGSLIKTINTDHTKTIYKLAVLQNGLLVSSSEDLTIKIWDTESGALARKTLTGHTSAIKALTVLQNGDLASGDCAGIIKTWSIQA